MKKLFIFLMFFCLTFVNVIAEGNYVTKIIVDGKEVEGIDNTKEEQTFDVGTINKEKISIVYEYDKNTYQIQGSYGQEVSLDYGKNEKSLIVTNKNDAQDKRVYKIIITREDTRSSDNSLSSLTVGGQKVVLGTSNEYNVNVDSKITSVEATGTLSNGKASFVDGYGERTGSNAVSLTGETTSFEIKVKAENGEVRTYKINVVKSNFKSNDATLKELKIEEIEFDFKSTTYEYQLTAKSDISKIKIKATPNSDKASLEYKEEVGLITGENIVEIKVTAEDGTKKTYKLTITKEEELPLVSDIKIKDVDFKFDSKKYSYTIETELKTLDITVTLSKETATYEIEGNEKLKNGSAVTIKVKDDDKTVTYKLKIKNSLEEEDLVTTTGNNTDFFKQNEMLIGLAVFGIGLLGMLMAILLRPKSKIM